MEKQRNISKKNLLYCFEYEIIKKCDISKLCFHKVGSNQWKSVYYKITEKFVDKTKTWKNGLHWANINGYSPKSMKNLLGCYSVNYSKWFYHLPEITSDIMVYFLIDIGYNQKFWIFESRITELIKVLHLLNETAFLNFGYLDYYIVSKKFKWIIGFNHHDIVSFVGEELNIDYMK